ncbi:RNAse T [Shewanella denitrificans OS217]|jgi:ribonuclease T|uniref:Ribonuclease T n=1 Tax=Shewanella denitrificans (strain OS217 / ATCC BAA-1090 / DSM 15013) TaxID=318161 RepID=RNT_SHEDO|nr:ribonuclease T [Shewanella denitrificans]Q12PE3.1 RecName: Full=Ribonuclease T; AltName: Full=Exoribonuclease T; Short=RNase T [Shewanella denitrificans OS217]ABE54683.1 RNAse T [Shewanella denitrificans OS217]
MPDICDSNKLNHRFRGYYPVVIDVETAGFNANTDALLEIAVTLLKMNDDGILVLDKTVHFHIEPFEGANLEPEALAFNGIDPTNPLRGAVSEKEAFLEIFKTVKKGQKASDCHRSIIVAHNAAFDLSFVNKAIERNDLKRSPFHPFASFDTATLAGLSIGHTVLAKACKMAGIDFDNKEAHSALYDTERTAELFCHIVNRWKALGGWPLATPEQSAIENTDEKIES